MSRPEWLTPDMEPFGHSRLGEGGIREVLPPWLAHHEAVYNQCWIPQSWEGPEWIKCTNHNKDTWNRSEIPKNFTASFPPGYFNKNWSDHLTAFLHLLRAQELEWGSDQLDLFCKLHQIAPAVPLPPDLRFGLQACWRLFRTDMPVDQQGKPLPKRPNYVPIDKFEKAPPRGLGLAPYIEPPIQWYGDEIRACTTYDHTGTYANVVVVEVWFEVLQRQNSKGRVDDNQKMNTKPADLGDLQVWVASIQAIDKPSMVLLLTTPDVDLSYAGTVSVWSEGTETELMMLSPAARLDMSWDRVPVMVTAAGFNRAVFPAYRKPPRDPYNR